MIRYLLLFAGVLALCAGARADSVRYTPVEDMTGASGPPFPTGQVAFDVSAQVDGRTTVLHRLGLSIGSVTPVWALGLSGGTSGQTSFVDYEYGDVPPEETEQTLFTMVAPIIISVPEGGEHSVLSPRIRSSDSFDLLFDVVVTGLGRTSHTVHWDTNSQPLDLDDVSLSVSSDCSLLLRFDLVRTGTDEPDYSEPLFSAEVQSGKFTAVPLPPTALMGLGLLGVLGVAVRLHRRWRKA